MSSESPEADPPIRIALVQEEAVADWGRMGSSVCVVQWAPGQGDANTIVFAPPSKRPVDAMIGAGGAASSLLVVYLLRFADSLLMEYSSRASCAFASKLLRDSNARDRRFVLTVSGDCGMRCAAMHKLARSSLCARIIVPPLLGCVPEAPVPSAVSKIRDWDDACAVAASVADRARRQGRRSSSGALVARASRVCFDLFVISDVTRALTALEPEDGCPALAPCP
jgi:hypothetical protein